MKANHNDTHKEFNMNMMRNVFAVLVMSFVFAPIATAREKAKDRIPTNKDDLIIHPIRHATFVMQWNGKTIYVDPVGGSDGFKAFPKPDLILITDIHGDHLNAKTVAAVSTPKTKIVAPAAVHKGLSKSQADQTPFWPTARKGCCWT